MVGLLDLQGSDFNQALAMGLLNAAQGVQNQRPGSNMFGNLGAAASGFGLGAQQYPIMQQQQALQALQAKKTQAELRKADEEAKQLEQWRTMFSPQGTPQPQAGGAPMQQAQAPQMQMPPQGANRPQAGMGNIPPQMIPFIQAMGPEKGSAFLAQLMARPEKSAPASVQEYEYAKGQGFSGTFQDYQQAQKADNNLVEIYDPNSPTQTRLVPRAQAANKPGKPASGLSFESDGQGGFRVVQGRGAGSGMSQPTANKFDEKLINSSEMLARLTDVSQQFKPEFLQLGTRVNMAGRNLKDFLGVNLDQQSQAELSDYAGFRRASVNNINRILNELSGAAVSPSEGERLKAAYPSAGTGIFDGDAPTEFQRKLDDATKETRNAILRYNYAKANGMNPLKTGVELQDVPALVERRGKAIEETVRSAMPGASPEAIKLETRARLAAEFGMTK